MANLDALVQDVSPWRRLEVNPHPFLSLVPVVHMKQPSELNSYASLSENKVEHDQNNTMITGGESWPRLSLHVHHKPRPQHW